MRIFNTKSRKLEKFDPIGNKTVKMYVCGITPYDTTHLGHAFTYVFFDVLIRYLEFKKFKVNYVQNVTDIDDDILKKANELNKDWKKLGDYWTNQFLKDMKTLNVKMPNHYVKSTESIIPIIRIIEGLLKKGFAYKENGNVYFDTRKFKEYGKLSRYNKEQMILLSRERGADPNDPLKKYPLDFVLWQKSRPKDDQPLAEKFGEPFWESPWGEGRPGWHIECSAMINQYLGEKIDIHGGGHDLIFPHHESEIAESESYTGKKPFVKYWVHTAMVLCEGEKMSKSLGNLVMVKDLLKKYSANEIRFVLLSHHYRAPWEYHEDEFKRSRRLMKIVEKSIKLKPNVLPKENEYLLRFEKDMDNDLNTPKALRLMLALVKGIEKNKHEKSIEDMTSAVCQIFKVLGFTPNH